ncbi:MAG: thiamine-monophosphate kinase [Alphaproteobacteria bacterium]|jgi:thiamine-monophosphate kinase
MSEFEFINRLKGLIKPNTQGTPNALNLSDDVCIIADIRKKQLIASQDSLCEDVHFFKDDPIEYIIKKAIRTNISDIASKGAKPYGMLLSLCLPKRYHNEAAQSKIFKALKEDLNYYDIALLGGDTTTGKTLTISITILGLCHHAMPLRRNIALGDKIYVTGTLGLSKIGLDLRLNKPDALNIQGDISLFEHTYLLPEPPLNCGIALAPYMNASMDISDGLLGDLQKMIDSSNKILGFDIDNTKVPCADIAHRDYALQSALYGGDDYQILFTSHHDTQFLMDIANQHQTRLSCIGIVNDKENTDQYQSFSHF